MHIDSQTIVILSLSFSLVLILFYMYITTWRMIKKIGKDLNDRELRISRLEKRANKLDKIEIELVSIKTQLIQNMETQFDKILGSNNLLKMKEEKHKQ